MNRKKLWKIIAAASTVLTLTTIEANSAQATSYTFTKIADTSGLFNSFLSTTINDSGTVAFDAYINGGSNGLPNSIFVSSDGAITPIVNKNSPFKAIFFPPIINNESTVAFGASLDAGGSGIFTSRGGAITTIADDNGLFENLSGSFISLNDNGAIAFNARLNTGVEGIFISRGGTPTAIIDDSDNLFDGFFSVPSLNNNGAVAFSAFLNFNFGIFTSSGGGSFSTIVTNGDPFDPSENLFFRSVGERIALNDNGTVVFQAVVGDAGPGADPNAVEGIFMSQRGVLTAIVDSRSSFENFDYVAINNSETIVFEACLDGNIICGLFTGADPVKDKVIDTNDLLFDSKLNQLGFFRDGLNNSGQIVFRATFQDGTSGIFRADPVPVPDPSSTLGLLALGTLGAGSTFFGKHKQHKFTK